MFVAWLQGCSLFLAAQHNGGDVLVLVPSSSLMDSWRQQIEQHTQGRRIRVHSEVARECSCEVGIHVAVSSEMQKYRNARNTSYNISYREYLAHIAILEQKTLQACWCRCSRRMGSFVRLDQETA